MLKAIKKRRLVRKYYELIERLTISERAAKLYVERNLEEYARLEEAFMEQTNIELVRICMALNELSPQ